MLMLVGGIHTGYEANAVDLLNELIAHFERTLQDVLPGMTLVLVPVANPDGLERGRGASGRFNAHDVDLNRNWDCEWSPDAVWQDRQVDPGTEPFSEPETIALAALIYDLRPDAVLFYHANANGVFAGECEGGGVSDRLAEVVGEGAGYPFGAAFTSYEVTGTEASWVDSLGIPAADVELSTTKNTEFTRNLNGILEVQRWLIGQQP
jgi:protein MpaA